MAKPTDATIEVWRMVIGDLEPDILAVATQAAISEPRPFAPSAGEFRGIALALTNKPLAPALEAWGLVKTAMRDYGINGKTSALDFIRERNPQAAVAAEYMGWRDFGMSDTDDEMSWRARFTECYQTYAKREADNLRDLPEVKKFKELHGGLSETTKKLSAKK